MGSRPRSLLLSLFLIFATHSALGCEGSSPRPPSTPGDTGGGEDVGPDEPSLEGTCVIMLPDEQPERLDFGNSAISFRTIKTFAISNTSTRSWKVGLGAIEFGASAFSLHDFSQAELFTIPAGESVEVGVVFNPPSYGSYQAFLPLEQPTWCNLGQIILTGTGVERTLLFEQQLDFSFVEPGSTAFRELSFQNIGNHPVTISFDSLSLTEPLSTTIGVYSPFWIGEIDGVALSEDETGFNQQRVVPAYGSSVTYRLAFRPGHDPGHVSGDPDFRAVAGPHQALLRISTDDARLATAEIALSGSGGGPKLATAPAAELHFGDVARGSSFTKTITVSNVGTNVEGTVLDNLRFRLCIHGDCSQAKSVAPEIKLADGSPSPDFKLVTWPPTGSGYKDATGLDAGKSLQLELRFEPTSEASELGKREAELHLYSTDPDKSDYVIRLMGNVTESPPCDVSVSSIRLDFGIVEPTRTSPLHRFVIKNRASTRCLIYSLELDQNTRTEAAFVLANGAKEHLSIEGHETLEVPLRFAPRLHRRYEGAVKLKLHRPHAPEEALLLAGEGGVACLALSPQSVEFGNVEQGFSARARTVTLANQCDLKYVTIHKASLLNPLGSPFRIIQAPPSYTMLASGEKTTLSLGFQPAGLGHEASSIELLIAEDFEEPKALFIPLSGRGSVDARQTERMIQDHNPMVDLLFVIDSSGSMSAYLQKVSTHFNLLSNIAIGQGIDYHIAAVTIDPGAGNGGSSGVVEGAFWPLRDKPEERVVRSSMPHEEQRRLFGSMTTMNASFSGTEWLIHPAVAALSPEMIGEGGHNAGFLRDGATLNVVTISDARDQATHELVEYQTFFQRLKPRGRFFYHGIIPVYSPGTCTYDGGPASADSPRVKTMIADTGGFLGDICTSDWTETLTNLYRAIFKSRYTFTLSTYPNLANGITVKVAGTIVSHWTYDPSRGDCGAIVFDEAHIPPLGAIVEIVYETAYE